ncbi:MAG TPA: hypothetical protein VE291_10285 [Terracidiphilus sp.]|jgi:hypothetical protein|nr:hypothetical protein [Terracidiphilus sp.]
MPESSLRTLIAKNNHQGTFAGHSVNGIQYELPDGQCGWHITTWPGRDPVNVYWVANGRFFAVKIHLITEPDSAIKLEVFDEIFYIVPDERAAILAAIAAWEA